MGDDEQMGRPHAEAWDWPTEMRRVAGRFAGREGVFVQLGDSLTFATPNVLCVRSSHWTAEERAFLEWAHAGQNDETDGWWLAAAEVGAPDENRSRTASV